MFSLGWLFAPKVDAKPSTDNHKPSLVVDPHIGEIALFPYNFVPDGWAECDGRLLPISGNEALFDLIGTTYGGDGRSTFALPDLNGRVPIGFGNAPGLSSRFIGIKGGSETHQLQEDELPAHSHSVEASSNAGTSHTPSGNVAAANRDGILHYGSDPDVSMASSGISDTGNGQPHNNMQPSMALRYCIALEGIFPTRD